MRPSTPCAVRAQRIRDKAIVLLCHVAADRTRVVRRLLEMMRGDAQTLKTQREAIEFVASKEDGGEAVALECRARVDAVPIRSSSRVTIGLGIGRSSSED